MRYEVLERGTQLGAPGLDDSTDAEVQQVVVEQGPQEELEREVVDLLIVLVGVHLEVAGLVRDEPGEDAEALLLAQLVVLLREERLACLAILSDEVVLVLEELPVAVG